MRRRDFAKILSTGVASSAVSAPRGIRVALITGAGAAHVNLYCDALAHVDEVQSVSFCDPSGASDALARQTLGRKLNKQFRDPKTLFREEKPDLAVITMEAVTSPPAIDLALNAHCHVLAEKPGCIRAADFEKLNTKAKSIGRQLLLALANRTDPAMLEAKRLVHTGSIGRIYGVEVHLIADQTRLAKTGYKDDWRAQKARAGGGHLIWLGIHWLDLATFITGQSVREVAGFTANVGGQPIDVEDSAVVALRFGNGALGTLTSGYYLDKGYHSHVKVWGSDGWLQVHKHTDVPLEWYSSRDPNPQVRRWNMPAGVPDSYTVLLRAVSRACTGDEPFPVTGDESLAALKGVFACYRAAETGRTQVI